MDESTLTALRGSIKKWESIVDGTGTDRGWTNCPLCEKFIDYGCEGCPVAEKSGHRGCHNTPHDAWYDADVEKVTDDKTRALAQAEMDFLRSLLPEGESP